MSEGRVVRSARVWITDGSGAPLTDLHLLRVSHPAALGPAAYKGTVDHAVPVGSATVTAERPDDALFPEAEWCLTFPEGMDPYIASPERVRPETPVIFQGMIEGKWINRLVDTLEWRPASIGNNLLAEGPGIRTTMGDIEKGAEGDIAVTYRYSHRGQEPPRTQHAPLTTLRGQNTLDLVRAILEHCRITGERIDWINFSALGVDAAIVNEPARLQAAMRAAQLTLSEVMTSEGFRRFVDQFARDVLSEGIEVPPGTPCQIDVRDGHGQTVGDGQLTWQR